MSRKFVFIRHDAHRTPLQTPYNGPFEVLKHGPKIFKINVNGKPQNVSIDRLKPAFIYFEDSEPSNDDRPDIPSNKRDQSIHNRALK